MSLVEYTKEKKLRVNVCKRNVMRCSRYGNVGRMRVKLNCEPLEEVDCFKNLGSQVAADGGRERYLVHKNNGYRAWGALKSGLSNREYGINVKCPYEGVIVITAL